MAKHSKMEALVLYICGHVDAPNIGATMLNKILWYVDTYAYRKLGKTVSGADKYVKRQYGPVPSNILKTLERLERKGDISIQDVRRFGHDSKKFVSLKQPSANVFSADEKQIVDEVVEFICNNHTATSISDLSHDVIWEAAKLGEEIPVCAVLAASPGEIKKADVAWARKVISSAKTVARAGAV